MGLRLTHLAIALSLCGCSRRRETVDLRCDMIQPSIQGRDWKAVLRVGPADAGAAGDSGRIVVRAYARAGSSPLPDVHAYGQQAGAVRLGTADQVPGGTLFVGPPGVAFVRTFGHGWASAYVRVDVGSGQTDTLDIYLDRWRTNCDSTTASPQ